MARLLSQSVLAITAATALGLHMACAAQPSTGAAQPSTGETARSETVPNPGSSSASAETRRLAAELLDLGHTNPIAGPTDSGQVTKAIASMLVKDLDSKNPNWGPSHPKWPEVSRLVEEDIAADLQTEMARRQDRYRAVLSDELARRLSADDLRQLLTYFHGTEGQRYLAFQSELAVAYAMAMGSAMSAANRPAASAPAPPVLPPSEEVMNERVKLIQLSAVAQITQSWLDEAKQKGGDTSGFQAWPMMVAMIASSQGPKLDDMRARYAPDLKNIEDFNVSSLGRHYHAAFGASGRALAEQTMAENRSFQEIEKQKFGGKWKGKYAGMTTPP